MVGKLIKRKTVAHRYVEQFVYGATDGVVSTFAVVAGASGAKFSAEIALVLGVANLIADGFSMGVSSYLSFTATGNITRGRAARRALVTFGSFAVMGSIPLIVYVLAIDKDVSEGRLFFWSSIMTAAAFILIGVMKSVITQKHSMIRSVVSSLLLGSAAAAVAYLIGFFVEKAITN